VPDEEGRTGPVNVTATPRPVVDAHQHVWDLSVRAQPWLDQDGLAPLRRNFTMADLEHEAAAAGVTSTVVVQTVIEPDETPELLALAAGHELIAGVVGWAGLADPGVGDEIAALLELPGSDCLAGLRHPVLMERDDGWLRRPEVLRGLAAVAEAGLAYDVVCTQRQLPAAVSAAAARPGLTFVLDHLGNPEGEAPDDGPWASALRQFAALPNTVAKLSGVLSEAFSGRAGPGAPGAPGVARIDPRVRRYFDLSLCAFGPYRLMFGSDWPPCTLTSSYAGVLGAARALCAELSPAEQAAVFAGTARRCYRLGPASE
jgi:L-fuconolactonase